MATKTYYFSGTTTYCRPKHLDEKYDNYQVNVHLDEESWKRFDESGIQIKKKANSEFGDFVTFKRPAKKIFGNKLQTFEAPDVLDTKGAPVTDLIGNGSKITVKVDVYDTMKGKGHRLISVRVDDLVKYERNVPVEDGAPTGKAPVSGIPF